jgi:fibrillarin-like pre-rRNA processing protein
MNKVKPYKFDGIFQIDGKIATINLVPGYRSANEELVKVKDVEYRIWDPYTSKPCAALKKGLKIFPIHKGQKILYLGFASGKTGSFFSDIIGKEGVIYAVEISERVLREAIPMAERRGNIICILNDARLPERYENIVIEQVDVVYCDIADPQEVEVFIRNCKKFLKKNGFGMISVKSRSIDAVKDPKIIYKEAMKKLEENNFKILDFVALDPYEKDHAFIVVSME